jgi:hypothetical protein
MAGVAMQKGNAEERAKFYVELRSLPFSFFVRASAYCFKEAATACANRGAVEAATPQTINVHS